MKKIYTLEHEDTWSEIKIQIDFDVPDVEENIKLMVEFWYGWEDRLAMEDGDYVDTFLKQLASNALRLSIEGNSLQGILHYFENAEGWMTLDGSRGIEILSVDSYSIEEYQFDIISEEEK